MTLVQAPVGYGPSGSALDPHAEAEILSDGRARGSRVRASARTVRRKKTQAFRKGNRNEKIETHWLGVNPSRMHGDQRHGTRRLGRSD
jgi:hypothetical protein